MYRLFSVAVRVENRKCTNKIAQKIKNRKSGKKAPAEGRREVRDGKNRILDENKTAHVGKPVKRNRRRRRRSSEPSQVEHAKRIIETIEFRCFDECARNYQRFLLD